MIRLKLALEADESGAVARVVIDRALADDMVAARFCLGLIVPKPRSRPIELDLPECQDTVGIVEAFGVTVAAMAAGEITPDEALTVTKVLDRKRRALEARARKQAAREAEASETPVVPAAATIDADLHSACIKRSDDSETPAADAAAPTVAIADNDLHSACIYRPHGGETPVADTPAAATVAAPPVTPRPQFPTFGSACIRPVLTGRAGRSAAPAPANRRAAALTG
jgi:hypothetical protein